MSVFAEVEPTSEEVPDFIPSKHSIATARARYREAIPTATPGVDEDDIIADGTDDLYEDLVEEAAEAAHKGGVSHPLGSQGYALKEFPGTPIDVYLSGVDSSMDPNRWSPEPPEMFMPGSDEALGDDF